MHYPFAHLTALVASPVPKKDMSESPEALASCETEWTRLGKTHAWYITLVREWAEVCATAREDGAYVHLGRVFGFGVEEGAQLPTGHKGRMPKCRVVFQGNNVKPKI